MKFKLKPIKNIKNLFFYTIDTYITHIQTSIQYISLNQTNSFYYIKKNFTPNNLLYPLNLKYLSHSLLLNKKKIFKPFYKIKFQKRYTHTHTWHDLALTFCSNAIFPPKQVYLKALCPILRYFTNIHTTPTFLWS